MHMNKQTIIAAGGLVFNEKNDIIIMRILKIQNAIKANNNIPINTNIKFLKMGKSYTIFTLKLDTLFI